MKTILIERVSNGWIARPFQPCSNWTTKEQGSISVFRTIEELQAALPSLLAEPIVNPVLVAGLKIP